MVLKLTRKEYDLRQCALMILRDQCPPERRHYLCMEEEDESTFDCIRCWDNYLSGIAAGTIELPKAEGRAAV